MQRYSYQGLFVVGIDRQAKPFSIPYFCFVFFVCLFVCLFVCCFFFFWFQSLNKINMVLEPNLFLAKHRIANSKNQFFQPKRGENAWSCGVKVFYHINPSHICNWRHQHAMLYNALTQDPTMLARR